MNPLAQKQRDTGVLIKDHLPAILTNDVAGVVTEIGTAVTKYKKGDLIFGETNMDRGLNAGGLQQYTLLEEATSMLVPQCVSPDSATTLVGNFQAGFIGFFDPTNLALPAPGTPDADSFDYPAQTVIIIGGGSDTGKLGIQIAALVGFGRIIVIASKHSQLILKSFGATHVIDRYKSIANIREKVLEITQSDGVLYVYDTVNSDHTLGVALLSGSQRGKVAGLLRNTKVDGSKIGEKKAGYDVLAVIGSVIEFFQPTGQMLVRELPGWIKTGKITPLDYKVVEDGLDVGNVNAVLDDYRDGKYPGRHHVHPSETRH